MTSPAIGMLTLCLFANGMDFSIHRLMFDINPFADDPYSIHFLPIRRSSLLYSILALYNLVCFANQSNNDDNAEQTHNTLAQKITQYFDIELRHHFFVRLFPISHIFIVIFDNKHITSAMKNDLQNENDMYPFRKK